MISSLLLADNLGHHPAADRLVLNLLRYAARDQDKPLGDWSILRAKSVLGRWT